MEGALISTIISWLVACGAGLWLSYIIAACQ
jgi:hypothetical protein